MSDSAGFDVAGDAEWINSLVVQTQRIDPASGVEAIRRFWYEIEEANAALDAAELSTGPETTLPVAFRADWREE